MPRQQHASPGPKLFANDHCPKPEERGEIAALERKGSGNRQCRRGNQHATRLAFGLFAAGHGQFRQALPTRYQRRAIRKVPGGPQSAPARRREATKTAATANSAASAGTQIICQSQRREHPRGRCARPVGRGVRDHPQDRWGRLVNFSTSSMMQISTHRQRPGSVYRKFRSDPVFQSYQLPRYLAALARSAARSVFSQVNSGSLRPKWPPEAVFW